MMEQTHTHILSLTRFEHLTRKESKIILLDQEAFGKLALLCSGCINFGFLVLT